MRNAIISRLKKNGQAVTVTDRTGTTWKGTVSHWDDQLFSIRLADGDDVCFPISHFASLAIPGGLEMRAEDQD